MDPRTPRDAAPDADAEGGLEFGDLRGDLPSHSSALDVDLSSERPPQTQGLQPDRSMRWLGGAVAACVVVLIATISAVRASDEESADAPARLHVQLRAPLQTVLVGLESVRMESMTAQILGDATQPIARGPQRAATAPIPAPGGAPQPSTGPQSEAKPAAGPSTPTSSEPTSSSRGGAGGLSGLPTPDAADVASPPAAPSPPAGASPTPAPSPTPSPTDDAPSGDAPSGDAPSGGEPPPAAAEPAPSDAPTPDAPRGLPGIEEPEPAPESPSPRDAAAQPATSASRTPA